MFLNTGVVVIKLKFSVFNKRHELSPGMVELKCSGCALTAIGRDEEDNLLCINCVTKEIQVELDYGNIEKLTLENTSYIKVIHTTPYHEVVLQCITTEDGGIEAEVHPYTSQFTRIESGQGVLDKEGVKMPLGDGVFFDIPPGQRHEVFTRGTEPLKLYSIYSPPHHAKHFVKERRF